MRSAVLKYRTKCLSVSAGVDAMLVPLCSMLRVGESVFILGLQKLHLQGACPGVSSEANYWEVSQFLEKFNCNILPFFLEKNDKFTFRKFSSQRTIFY